MNAPPARPHYAAVILLTAAPLAALLPPTADAQSLSANVEIKAFELRVADHHEPGRATEALAVARG
jgi:hypothetical protein